VPAAALTALCFEARQAIPNRIPDHHRGDYHFDPATWPIPVGNGLDKIDPVGRGKVTCNFQLKCDRRAIT
jgi:hypothetical protein